MTVRRNLDRLIRKRIVQRFHGGAIISRTNEYEPPHMIRSLEMMLDLPLEESYLLASIAGNLRVAQDAEACYKNGSHYLCGSAEY